ncbi:hypothetical protein K438DRAFT_1760948 [Mycena galopus ATCC 62051]|nr:hypothetical protein K438DRAFT_1760948 [Mycena galopus ATCC 62051]
MGSIIARLSPPSFRPERDIPDLSGKIILVTGGNTGIGYETIKQLLLKNAKVYLAARSPEKAAAAIKRLEYETHRRAIFLQLDLADLRSVRRSAETFLAQEARLDILFNNGLQRKITTFLPALTNSYQHTQTLARVINTSSRAHASALGNGLDYVSLKGGPERDAWIKKMGEFSGSLELYHESKIGNVFVSNYFAKAHSDVLVSCAISPGPINTDLQRHAAGFLQVLTRALFYPAPLGAFTQLWGATLATPEQINGQYLIPWGKVGKADPRTANQKLEDQALKYIREQIEGF